SNKPVFTLTLQDAGGQPEYKFELHRALDHTLDPDSKEAADLVLDIPFTVVDADGDSVPGNFAITVKDDSGLGAIHKIDVDEDGSVSFNTSADGATSNVTLEQPAYGDVKVDDNGKITYTPKPNFSGEDRF